MLNINDLVLSKTSKKFQMVILFIICVMITCGLNACGNNYLTLRTMSDEIYNSGETPKGEDKVPKDYKSEIKK
jgi:hypothetical protein